MAKSANVVLTFAFERETKNTIRFQEQVKDTLDTPRIGTIYVAKQALRELGWQQGKGLEISIVAK